MNLRHPRSSLFPYTTLFRSEPVFEQRLRMLPVSVFLPMLLAALIAFGVLTYLFGPFGLLVLVIIAGKQSADRKSTRLNSSHLVISYAVFCLKKKKTIYTISISDKDQKMWSFSAYGVQQSHAVRPRSL